MADEPVDVVVSIGQTVVVRGIVVVIVFVRTGSTYVSVIQMVLVVWGTELEEWDALEEKVGWGLVEPPPEWDDLEEKVGWGLVEPPLEECDDLEEKVGWTDVEPVALLCEEVELTDPVEEDA